MVQIVHQENTCVIVGGSSGIGCEAAALFSANGWRVVNISRTPCKNDNVSNICADVAVGEDAFRGIKLTAEKHGLQLLVYCAGCSMAAPIEYAEESDYKYLFEVNFFGALKAMQAAVPYMKSRGGKIILVGSLGGDIPIIFDSFYSASKAALEMLARSACAELKPYNIKVTAFLPGGTATGFTFKRKIYSDEASGSYAGNLNKAVQSLAKIEQGGMSARQVALDIYKTALADNPPVIKASGAKNAAYRIMSRVMPEKLTLYMAERTYGQQ